VKMSCLPCTYIQNKSEQDGADDRYDFFASPRRSPFGLLVFAKVQSTSMNWVKCVSLFSLEIRMVADIQILELSV